MSGNSSGRGSRGGEPAATIPFGSRYAESDLFKTVFREGMALVEATATYLDGEGRAEAKALGPAASLAYATESMRLTTRLLQLASWLLIRRAVNQGEVTPEQALEQERKLKLRRTDEVAPAEARRLLPRRLSELIEASERMHRRIVTLDRLIRAERAGLVQEADNPLDAHMDRLRAAFPRPPDASEPA